MTAPGRVGRLGHIVGPSTMAFRGAMPARLPLRASTTISCPQPLVAASCLRLASSESSQRGKLMKIIPSTAWVQYPELFPVREDFASRHIGPDNSSIQEMLGVLDPPVESLDQFVQEVIPADILSKRELFPQTRVRFHATKKYPTRQGHQEWEIMKIAESMASSNRHSVKAQIGAGYYGTLTPEVIKRNVLESPAWYTSYTPYQPEISQGRLESLLNFQTMVTDLTGLPIANASLLDEGTAAAEAMTMSLNALPASRAKRPAKTYVLSNRLHPQTRAVLRGRAEGFGVNIITLDFHDPEFPSKLEELGDDLVGVMVQYPDTTGQVLDHRQLADLVHKQGALLSVATDLLALTMLTPPGEWGADIAFGNSQRFGVPLGFGGPHAAFFAVQEKHKRKMPGRLIGVSKDRLGGRALRLSLQTREQHIRREKATSNVCTAQALLANISSFYAVYHGPEGLRAIAERCNLGARVLESAAKFCGLQLYSPNNSCSAVPFDTLVINQDHIGKVLVYAARERGINIRFISTDSAGISVDETTTENDLISLIGAFQDAARSLKVTGRDEALDANPQVIFEHFLKHHAEQIKQSGPLGHLPEPLRRTSSYLTHPVFNTHHSETELLRYIHHLQSKDLSLVHSMIPLGSCTMKLNASAEMALITLPGFSNLHPFVPPDQSEGYSRLTKVLESQLIDITGMDACSLQPNSGAQGEFAGLRVIRKYLQSRAQSQRDICLIPVSAHGTNPASASMAGMRVVPIKCDTKTGNLDLADLEAKCKQYENELAAMMITYPSTFGVFEPAIKKVCQIVHAHGGQVYMDGANMNAQVGLCSPGEIGADVCHLNLHKTFCIPHGGGGPGVGPICVKEHLAGFLPTTKTMSNTELNLPVSSASYGSASILPISWAYNALMGGAGLKKATQVTLLNANYLLSRLKEHYPILYTNEHGRCAHEFIIDARPFEKTSGIQAIDIAKRLQDYGFHAPTMSWPVANTLMIEPTESESKEELDRFVDALIAIREEIREVEEGKQPREGNVLKMSPHPISDIIGGDGEAGNKWDRPYSREKAAYPLPWLREKKFWPSVARVNDTYGDLNLFCTCPPVEDTTGGNQSSIQEQ
ncbi:hypothetical protein GE21DRAFT_638 [Neurospora crassa]|uniref:Glycine cleavage system P protein n=2 Tax=Neurospora crassa TaxID=5141 RepID=Q7SG89_NEUCR|nr:glycine dehydrogenase [Neurospora crassa OR74A]EAA35833.3 glycine dehydrogenase [Neurospora crassa OR74A]KHE80890.1 hypothetical protein GE21DRAFT_638 [Neurospora crassa]CAE76410.1 probable glycine decarboxylase P subunit [Neurospora crassa]|eukprot:XP_965069.3 glycine dehydrogenase [Neurospora crassa OR74A]